MGVLARKRVGRVLGLVAACFVLLLARIIYVQFIWAEELGQQALDMRMQDIPIQPRRGSSDRNGHELLSASMWNHCTQFPPRSKTPLRRPGYCLRFWA